MSTYALMSRCKQAYLCKLGITHLLPVYFLCFQLLKRTKSFLVVPNSCVISSQNFKEIYFWPGNPLVGSYADSLLKIVFSSFILNLNHTRLLFFSEGQISLSSRNLCRLIFFEGTGMFEQFPAAHQNGIISFLKYKPITKSRWTWWKFGLYLQPEARRLTTATSSHQDLVKAFLLRQKTTNVKNPSYLHLSSLKNITGTAQNWFIFHF